jgi:dynactin-5
MPPTTNTTTTKPPSKPSKSAPKGDFIETDTGNKVARRAQLHGTQHIILGGRAVIQADVCIRGDLVRPASSAKDAPSKHPSHTSAPGVAVAIGRYSFISSGTILRPPLKMSMGRAAYYPLKIGEHTFIGANCVIEAAQIGDRVHIGRGAVVGKFAILKDGVKVLEGAHVVGGMVVASGFVVGGWPARVVGEVGEGWGITDGGEGGDLREMWRATG